MGSILFIPKKRNAVFPAKFGLLYNWYAVTDARLITNTGWHIPTQAEFQALLNYLGAGGNYSTNTIGGKLKETGTTYWQAPNSGATNEVAFNARAGGLRNSAGSFTGQLSQNMIWSATATIANAILMQLSYNNLTAYIGQQSRKQGNSVRPVKDSTLLTHGQTGTYTGNDGKVYRTICINGVEYLADNLAETKFRNGVTIPEITDSTAWNLLTTAGMCAYNNDWNNV